MERTLNPLVQQYTDFLAQAGYEPSVDAEGDVYFKIQGGHYFLRVSEKDPLSFILLYPNFYAAKTEADRRRALEAASEVNTKTKAVKVFVAGGDTQATVEILLAREGDFKDVFPRALELLQAGVGRFREIVRERAAWPQSCMKA
ncbi:putative sensory transduction regulator [Deinococcus yavapaiensis KR-236]|uniref:Putative sensory transduction regulator n=2 Tax=Deinococcus TaxID=1298 RepID=A0A318STT6_9DEIO|nr:putative sensory transduction regulator [Deinococcus yavapaiensis KR-236]